jgi:hypothetical protein
LINQKQNLTNQNEIDSKLANQTKTKLYPKMLAKQKPCLLKKTTLPEKRILTNQPELNLPKLCRKKMSRFWKPDLANFGHCQKKELEAKLT